MASRSKTIGINRAKTENRSSRRMTQKQIRKVTERNLDRLERLQSDKALFSFYQEVIQEGDERLCLFEVKDTGIKMSYEKDGELKEYVVLGHEVLEKDFPELFDEGLLNYVKENDKVTMHEGYVILRHENIIDDKEEE